MLFFNTISSIAKRGSAAIKKGVRMVNRKNAGSIRPKPLCIYYDAIGS